MPHFTEVVRIGHQQNDLQAIASAQYDLALIRRRQGHLRQAITLLEEILALAEEQGAEDLGYLGRPEAGLASAHYTQNKLREARQHLERSQALNERWHNPNHDIRTYLTLARLEIGEGHFVAAAAALEKGLAVGREFAVVPFLRQRATALQGLLWLRQGELATAARWLAERGWSAPRLAEAIRTGDEEIDFGEGLEAVLVAVRIHLALADTAAESPSGRRVARYGDGQPPAPAEILKAVQEALEALLTRSRAVGQGEITLSLLLLQALAYQRQADENAALAAVEEALAIAAPEGYVRVFLDEGAPMAALLQACRPRLAGHERLHRYAGRLLAAFPAAGPAEAPETQPLVEPLTERELEVLALMAEGLTNRQIGEALVIARGTVKAHAASIYGKLDVHNRTSAVARARELGLL